jgi:hypothetical protein
VADDPTWTANQLAAVQAVDAFMAVIKEAAMDPPNFEFGHLAQVATDPAYSADVRHIQALIDKGRRLTGYSVPVSRSVGQEQTVNDRPEISVWQCDETEPGTVAVYADGSEHSTGASREAVTYAVQLVGGTWLVAAWDVPGQTC